MLPRGSQLQRPMRARRRSVCGTLPYCFTDESVSRQRLVWSSLPRLCHFIVAPSSLQHRPSLTFGHLRRRPRPDRASSPSRRRRGTKGVITLSLKSLSLARVARDSVDSTHARFVRIHPLVIRPVRRLLQDARRCGLRRLRAQGIRRLRRVPRQHRRLPLHVARRRHYTICDQASKGRRP